MAKVVRVWGLVDGVETNFEYNEEAELWQAVATMVNPGYFAIEVFMEDAAGNRSFMAKLAGTADTSTLRCSFSVLEVGASFTIEQVKAMFGIKDVQTRIMP